MTPLGIAARPTIEPTATSGFQRRAPADSGGHPFYSRSGGTLPHLTEDPGRGVGRHPSGHPRVRQRPCLAGRSTPRVPSTHRGGGLGTRSWSPPRTARSAPLARLGPSGRQGRSRGDTDRSGRPRAPGGNRRVRGTRSRARRRQCALLPLGLGSHAGPLVRDDRRPHPSSTRRRRSSGGLGSTGARLGNRLSRGSGQDPRTRMAVGFRFWQPTTLTGESLSGSAFHPSAKKPRNSSERSIRGLCRRLP